MNKKIVIGLIAAILVVAIGVGVFFALRNNNDQDKNSGSANGVPSRTATAQVATLTIEEIC